MIQFSQTRVRGLQDHRAHSAAGTHSLEHCRYCKGRYTRDTHTTHQMAPKPHSIWQIAIIILMNYSSRQHHTHKEMYSEGERMLEQWHDELFAQEAIVWSCVLQKCKTTLTALRSTMMPFKYLCQINSSLRLKWAGMTGFTIHMGFVLSLRPHSLYGSIHEW
jgi:hypothetical protein